MEATKLGISINTYVGFEKVRFYVLSFMYSPGVQCLTMNESFRVTVKLFRRDLNVTGSSRESATERQIRLLTSHPFGYDPSPNPT